MTAIQDFIANPNLFLDNNCLQTEWSGSQIRTRPAVIFERSQRDAIRQRDNVAIPAYKVIPIQGSRALTMRGGPNVDYLYAYYCPYGPNETLGITVGTLSNFMFTTTMDGCTFGVGSATANGSRRVAHSNVVGVGTANQAAQMGILAVGGLTDIVVDPVAYRGAANAPLPNSITTIGVRNPVTGAWRFLYQTWTVPHFGGRPTVVSVTDL